MDRDPVDIRTENLNPLGRNTLEGYNQHIDEIVQPPFGIKDPDYFYRQIPDAKEIHDSFVSRTPVYKNQYDAFSSEELPVSADTIIQAREINSYKLDSSIPIPKSIEDTNSQSHWDLLISTLPRGSRISFFNDTAVVDFLIESEEGNINFGTMILDLRDSSKRDGIRVNQFLQTNIYSEVIKSPLLREENIQLRFKDTGIFFKIFKNSTTIASASRSESTGSVINLHTVGYGDTAIDVPLIYHEISHHEDRHFDKYDDKSVLLLAGSTFNSNLLPITVAGGLARTVLYGTNPWLLLFTGGQFALDRLLYSMSRDPNTEVGKAFANRWVSEMTARFSQKVIAELLRKNLFIGNYTSNPNILDYYQPALWTAEDIWKRERAEPKPSPQPIPSLV